MNISRSALLAYSVEQMYDIVADVRAYPDFLNWCESVDVVSDQVDVTIATLTIAYGRLNISFTTKNNNVPNQRIELSLVDGPFSNLAGEWSFLALDDQACKVSIEMNFDFDRSLAPSIFGKVFEKIIALQLEAFQKRADQLHGSTAA